VPVANLGVDIMGSKDKRKESKGKKPQPNTSREVIRLSLAGVEQTIGPSEGKQANFSRKLSFGQIVQL
jgi:hypothetical protein